MKKNKKKLKFKNLKQKIPESIESPGIIQEVNLHYPIKLSLWQIVKSYLSTTKVLQCCSKSEEESTLQHLNNLGTDRIAQDLSIERLVKHIRDSKIFIKQNLTDKDKFYAQYHKRNVINLDEDSQYNDAENIDFED